MIRRHFFNALLASGAPGPPKFPALRRNPQEPNICRHEWVAQYADPEHPGNYTSVAVLGFGSFEAKDGKEKIQGHAYLDVCRHCRLLRLA